MPPSFQLCILLCQQDITEEQDKVRGKDDEYRKQ